MKRKLFLTAAAVLCVLNLTACGGRRNEPGARSPETTATAVIRETVRTDANRSRVAEDVSEMASDAAREAKELASDAASKGKELMTDAASDVRDAVDNRRGDGDYNADDDGDVQKNRTEPVSSAR